MDRADSLAARSLSTSAEAVGAGFANSLGKLGRKDSNLQSPDPESGDRELGGVSTEDGALGTPVQENQTRTGGRPYLPPGVLSDGTILGPEDAVFLNRYRARHAVHRAVKRGQIRRPKKCQRCREPFARLEAHHHKGYAREFWLVVKFLCRRCHTETHNPASLARRVATLPSAFSLIYGKKP